MKSVTREIDNILRGVIDVVYKNEVSYFMLINSSLSFNTAYKDRIWQTLLWDSWLK